MAAAASIVPGLPHITSRRSSSAFRDQLDESVRVLPRWGEPVQRKSDPGLAHPETPLVIVIRKVRLVAALEVGNVIAA